MGVIWVKGTLTCRTEAEAAIVREHLPQHIELSRAEPGCLSFNVDPTDDPMVWQINESFADADALKTHQARAQASAWGLATKGIPRDFELSKE